MRLPTDAGGPALTPAGFAVNVPHMIRNGLIVVGKRMGRMV